MNRPNRRALYVPCRGQSPVCVPRSAQARNSETPIASQNNGSEGPLEMTNDRLQRKTARNPFRIAGGSYFAAADAWLLTGEILFVVDAAEEVALAVHKRIDAATTIERRFRDHRRVRNV